MVKTSDNMTTVEALHGVRELAADGVLRLGDVQAKSNSTQCGQDGNI